MKIPIVETKYLGDMNIIINIGTEEIKKNILDQNQIRAMEKEDIMAVIDQEEKKEKWVTMKGDTLKEEIMIKIIEMEIDNMTENIINIIKIIMMTN